MKTNNFKMELELKMALAGYAALIESGMTTDEASEIVLTQQLVNNLTDAVKEQIV